MPKQLYKLNDFSGGLNTVKDVADINDNEVNTAQNLMFNIYGGMQPAYSMTDSTNNKISAYNNDEITTVQPGYGLGYFETDHVRDSTTVSFTGTNDNTGGSEDGFFVYQEDGSARSASAVNNRLKYLVNGVVQDLGASFSIGDALTLSGNTSDVTRSFSDGMIRASAQGVYTVVDTANSGKELILDRGLVVRLDSATAGHFNLTVVGHSKGDNVILLADPAAHNIDVFSTSANNYTHNVITLRSSATDTASKVKYYKIEDSIRCCDTADKNDCKIQWYGWIQRRHFDGTLSSTGAVVSYMNYFAKDNDLSKPSEDDLASSTGTAGAVSSYPASAGTGFEIAIATETDVNGFIEAGEYELASTFIYDGNQESLPFKYTNTHTVADENALKSFSVNIGATGPYDPRISGGRIYIRKKGDDSEFVMLVDIDLTKGARIKLSDDYTAWHDAGSSQYNCPTATASANFSIKQLGFITYEVINGFSSSIFSNALGDSGEHWKDAVIANNRVFVCNVTMKDEDTGDTKSDATLRSYPDRIMYSMPNRYDTFPSDNFIEASKGDADVYVAIEAYADRLLAYKNKSLDIINISGDDRNWFLEDSKKYQGVLHPEAVKRTQYGVLWANKQGLYLYDGSSIRNLKENKISDSDWSTHIGSVSGIIYDEQESMAFVIKNLGSNGDAYMCDLKKGNFTLLKDFVLDTNDGITNSVDTEGNQTLIGHDAGSSIDIYQLYRTVAATDGVRFTTKALDFGNPFQVKKIYSVHITYKSDIALTGMFVLREEDNTQTALNGTVSASATNWAKVELTPTSPVVCNKVSLQFNSSTSSAKVYINDISIEYRAIYRKGV
jgi:hypothetical protein